MAAAPPSASEAPEPDRGNVAEQVFDRPGSTDFETFFRRYEVGIGRFLAQMVSDRALADDLLQETFLSAFHARDQLDTIENPEAWLFRIARNCALQSFRSSTRALNAAKRLAHQRPEVAADPAEAIAVRDHLERVLKPDERSVLILSYVHGFSSKELGEMTGRTPEAIRQELSRSRKKLIQTMDTSPDPKQGGGKR